MPAKTPKKPSAPKQPKKPTSKSKTGNSACSQAASNWQLAIRGKEPLDPNTYKTLAQCRSMSSQKKAANLQVHSGKLNEQGRDALVGRLQKRADQGLLYKKDREARLKMLLDERKTKQTAAAATDAREQRARQLVEKVRSAPKYELAKERAKANQKKVADTLNNPQDIRIERGEHRGENATYANRYAHERFRGKNSVDYALDDLKEARRVRAEQDATYGERMAKQHLSAQPKTPAPAFSLSSGPQFGTNGKNAQGVLFSTPTALDRQVSADQAARGKPLAGQTSMFDKPAVPISREAALVQKVRGLPGYGVAKASATANRELVGFRMKEKAKPAAPKFSRNGQLAPGRGTEERKQLAIDKWEDRPRRFLMGETYLTTSGEPMLVHGKRQGYITAFPYVDGKPAVSSETAIKFSVTQMARRIAPHFRTDLTNKPFKPMPKQAEAATPAFVAKRNAKPTSSASAIPEGYKMEPAETVQLGYYNTGGVVPKAGKGRKQAGVFVTEPDGYKRFFDNERAARKWLSAQ